MRDERTAPANLYRSPGPLPPLVREPAAYDRAFWFAYASNTLMMIACSLLFRYGDFVNMIGGAEYDLGKIVGVGAIGSLLMRLTLGNWIDRYGARKIWITSMVVVTLVLLAHLTVSTVHSPTIYVVRVIYNTCLAGVFGASITYISLRAPIARMAEVVGMLGSSGFIGMAVGSQLSDWICRHKPLTTGEVNGLFLVASALAFGSTVLCCIATRDEVHPTPRPRPPLAWLIRRYHPGTLLLIAVAIGFGIGLPGTFLTPFTSELGFAEIGTFFGVYSATAFVTRVGARKITESFGTRNTVLLGMAFLVLSLVLYLPVNSPWQLIFPAMSVGVAHALLFPAIVAGGSTSFPTRYRGLGVTLTLAFFDLGSVVGMPIAGRLVELARGRGYAPYTTMYIAAAIFLTFASLVFGITYRKQDGGTRRTDPEPVAETPA